jgi:hypothetical protein
MQIEKELKKINDKLFELEKMIIFIKSFLETLVKNQKLKEK